MNRVVIVVNAAARGQALEIAEGASRALDAAGIEAHSFYPPAPGGVTELVAEAATDPKTFAVALATPWFAQKVCTTASSSAVSAANWLMSSKFSLTCQSRKSQSPRVPIVE